MKRPSHLPLKLAVLGLCAAYLAAWTFFGLPCLFRSLTGIICPGCGMSRAVLSALRLDFSQAFYYHPMFCILPVLALEILFDFRLFPKRSYDTALCVCLAAAVLGCYFVRLIAFLQGNLAI